MATINDIKTQINTMNKRSMTSMATVALRAAEALAAIAAAGLPGVPFAVISPKVFAYLSTQEGVYTPDPIVVTTGTDADGNPITVTLPTQGPCGTLFGFNLILDPGAKGIGIGLLN
jgi:hypothetical protein